MTYDGFQPVTKDELHTAVVLKKKIQAIKMYRERTGAGLPDAKREVESAMEDYFIEQQRNGTTDLVKRQNDINKFLDKVMDEVVVLEHLNAPILRATLPSSDKFYNMQYNRRMCKERIITFLNTLFSDLNSK